MSVSETVGPRLRIPGKPAGPYSSIILMEKPNSSKRKKPTDLFRNATDRTVRSVRQKNVIYRQIIYGDGTTGYGYLSSGQWTTSNAESIALRECHGKMLDSIKRQNVNLAMMMAEYRQSTKLFLSLAQELNQGWRALRRLHFGELYRDIKRSREFSKKWIELQFGLLPLISDLEGICVSLSDSIRDGTYIYMTERVTVYERKDRTIVDPEGNGKIIEDFSERVTSKLDVRYLLKDPKMDNFRRFGFSNPAALAWELVPFSFVVDWAIGVGDWLNRLDALVGVSDLQVNQSGLQRLEFLRSCRGATASMVVDRRSRSVTSQSLQIPRPRYEPSQSLRKVATGLALIRLLGR